MNNLYQLRSKFKMVPGQYFLVDGPHDTHGKVIKCEYKPKEGFSYEFLNLIRGTGHRND